MKMRKIAVSALCAALIAGAAAPISSLAYDRTGWTGSVTETRDGEFSKVIDGDTGSRWATSSGNSADLVVNFNASITFDTIIINNGSGDMPQNGYKVSTSTDGTNYTDPVTYNGTANITTIKLDQPVTATHLKLTGEGSSSTWWSVYELAVCTSTLNEVGDSVIFAGKADAVWVNGSDMPFAVVNNGGSDYTTGSTGDSSASKAFSDDVSESIRTEFGGSSSATVIEDVYLPSKCVNFIGYNNNNRNVNNTVQLKNLNLKKGTYELYVLGYNNGIGAVTCGGESMTQKGDKTTIADNVQLYTYEITLNSDFTGDIVMSNDSGWLPDLYSAKLKYVKAPEAPKVDSTYEVTDLNDGAAFDDENATDDPAKAFGLSVTPNDYDIKKITVKVGEKSVPKEVNISGTTEVKYGIIVQGDNANSVTADSIKVIFDDKEVTE